MHSLQSDVGRAQAQRILEFLRFPGMAALYDASGNVVARAGAVLSRPSGMRVVNLGEGYRLCVQLAGGCGVGDRVDRGVRLLKNQLRRLS